MSHSPLHAPRSATVYYLDKEAALADLFGGPVRLTPTGVVAGDREYPIIDDVIILLDPAAYPAHFRRRLRVVQEGDSGVEDGGDDIQFTFGQEWQAFPSVLPEHETEFRQYFDLVDPRGLGNARVCDLGCGIGRWSVFLSRHCRELVLVDFSDAIFVARRNLSGVRNALFFLGDLRRLPFRRDFADLIVCLGVLHHLPEPALAALRRLRYYGPRWLVYLYYALDNRPAYYRLLLRWVTAVRRTMSRIRMPALRSAFVWAVAVGVYWPLIALGRLADGARRGSLVPLYETYRGKGIQRIRQDVYDRFFTSIEQRVSRREIETLQDTFARVVISDHMPYWHFLCERE